MRWRGHRAASARDRDRTVEGGWPELELTGRRSRLPQALDALDATAHNLGLEPRVLAHPGVAQAFVRLEGIDADRGAALAGALEALPIRAAWRAAPPELARAIDPFGVPSPALPLMRELRGALDPAGLFAAGRFHGGL